MVILGPTIPEQEPQSKASFSLLRVAVSVSDLKASIKFYSKCFDILLKTPLDVPSYQRALIAPVHLGRNDFSLELFEEPVRIKRMHGDTPQLNVEDFTLIVMRTKAVLDVMKENGYASLVISEQAAVIPVRSPSSSGPQTRQHTTALVADVDGYIWRLIELSEDQIQSSNTNRMASISINVTNLNSALSFWRSILGASVQSIYEASLPPTYKTALVGFGPEIVSTQLELKEQSEQAVQHVAFKYIVLASRHHAADFVSVVCGMLTANGMISFQVVEISSVKQINEVEQAIEVTVDPPGLLLYIVAGD